MSCRGWVRGKGILSGKVGKGMVGEEWNFGGVGEWGRVGKLD